MRRLFLCLSLAILATMLIASPASAGRRWCARDPIVILNGNVVQVWIAIPDASVQLVNGPVEVKFETPKGINRLITLTDDGFNGHGEVVSFSDNVSGIVDKRGEFPVRIRVSVPTDTAQATLLDMSPTFPIQITVIEGNETHVFQGVNTGTWVTTMIGDGTSTP